jgi:glutamate--cysteine ligase
VRIHDQAAREAARGDVARRGLAARYGEEPMLEVARDVARLAHDGLRRIAHAGKRDADESGFLDPVFETLEQGRSPGQLVAERWEGDWQRSVERLIDYARYR